jgi:hypothetical protein
MKKFRKETLERKTLTQRLHDVSHRIEISASGDMMNYLFVLCDRQHAKAIAGAILVHRRAFPEYDEDMNIQIMYAEDNKTATVVASSEDTFLLDEKEPHVLAETVPSEFSMFRNFIKNRCDIANISEAELEHLNKISNDIIIALAKLYNLSFTDMIEAFSMCPKQLEPKL